MTGPKEVHFEDVVTSLLVAVGGYQLVKNGLLQGPPRDFKPEWGLDTAELFAFIGQTQQAEWDKLIALRSGDTDLTQRKFCERLARVLDDRGTLSVLRDGVDDLGVNIRLAYFRPAHGLNPETASLYERNRLTVTRQLPYEPKGIKTLDLCLFVNGLPVATAELKTHLTGQTAEHAKAQYESARDPKNVTLGRRALVHFALDTETVWMTTKLDEASTRFLPFNRGCNDGAGNPPNLSGHRTGYLWERVWQRDAWLDILHRFVHVEPTKKGKAHTGSVIFPRYHQWDAVLHLEGRVLADGVGTNYLVQHSAGSGKSNTIAWLAHRLSNLHNENDKVFDKVIVITDRLVLDKQLQATVAQFEKVAGVVQRIDENSQQLADALTGEQARIIVTTIQKFPHVLAKMAELPNRRYAVIADEAHSSQSGEASKELKKVLGRKALDGEVALAQAEAAEISLVQELPDVVQDKLALEIAARGRQKNLSFFAFTATPKSRTLELFGQKNPTTNKFEATHLYSMRQAIEEGFVHDVLEFYMTYETYWNIERRIKEDPEYDPGKAKAAIAKFVSLHAHNLQQKADIIITHFRGHVAGQVGGKGKAMVVTASRLHALRYGEALKEYCREHGIGDVGVLVAFSGTIEDRTEAKINGFPDSQTPKKFGGDDYQILVVAEKYQTGFDQPKLHTMYVDKTLSGLAAVQTLSRLNRRHPDKTSTFVMDFRNSAEDILKAFEPWYVRTVSPPTDPNLMYDAHHQMSEYGILWPAEAEDFVRVLLADPWDTGRIHAMLEPVRARFETELDEDEQEGFRDGVKRFVNTYSYLSQIAQFGDVKLERDYLFCRALAPFIRRPAESGLDLSGQIDLVDLATKATFTGKIALTTETGEVEPPSTLGGRVRTPEEIPLSEIIAELNKRFGGDLTRDHHVRALIDQLSADEDLQIAANVNDAEGFKLALSPRLQDGVIDQATESQVFVKKFLDDPEYAAALLNIVGPLIQTKAKVARQEHCPIGELLRRGEDKWLEYKSTFRVDSKTGDKFIPVETAAIKTVAAFLNSYDGGTLLLGVAEDADGRGVPFGIVLDYVSVRKEGKGDADMFGLMLNQVLVHALGVAAVANLTTEIVTVDGHDICRVHVKPCGHPVEANVKIANKDGQFVKQTLLYIRLNNQTVAITDDSERQKFISQRWPS